MRRSSVEGRSSSADRARESRVAVRPTVSPQDPTISRPISRSSRACAAQSAAVRTIGWPGLLARVDLISNRTAAALGRSWSRSHSNLRFANGYLPGGPILCRTFTQLVEPSKDCRRRGASSRDLVRITGWGWDGCYGCSSRWRWRRRCRVRRCSVYLGTDQRVVPASRSRGKSYALTPTWA